MSKTCKNCEHALIIRDGILMHGNLRQRGKYCPECNCTKPFIRGEKK